MKRYTDPAELVINLHQKGFTQDFQLKGNDLYLVDDNKFICIGEFTVVEFHKVINSNSPYCQSVVLGIAVLHHNIKGILLRHYKSPFIVLPPVLLKKLHELEVEGLRWENIHNYSHQISHD